MNVKDPELATAVTAFENAEDSIAYVLNNPDATITLSPRATRPDDKIKIFPGEHAGVSIQIVTPTGVIARVNFYGGLRDSQHASDQHDMDKTLRHSHATRTDAVASQPTQINLHMFSPGHVEPFLDIWMISRPNKIQLTTFKFEGPHDVNVAITDTDYGFKTITSGLHKSMKNLMLMVPNPFSPRA